MSLSSSSWPGVPGDRARVSPGDCTGSDKCEGPRALASRGAARAGAGRGQTTRRASGPQVGLKIFVINMIVCNFFFFN